MSLQIQTLTESLRSLMAVSTTKSKSLRNILFQVLYFGVLLLAVRFAFLFSLTGDLCFSDNHGNGDGDGILFECLRRNSRTYDIRQRRRALDYYSSIFQDLIAEEFLSSNSKVLCVGTLAGEDVAALREIGVPDSVGIVAGEAYNQPFSANTFDFEFAAEGRLDRAVRVADFAAEIGRTLKPGGFFVAHSFSVQEPYSLNSFIDLFKCCRLISVSEIDGLDSPSVREIVMKKESAGKSTTRGGVHNKCSIPGYKREIILNAEPLIEQEPTEPWLNRKTKSIKYLTSMVDISFKERYVYVDVGDRSFDSSIGNWFMKEYPKQNKTFEIFAVESDKAFHGEYAAKKEVILLPLAAWIRNETLFFEISREAAEKKRKRKKTRMRRVGARPVMPTASYVRDGARIRGFDFAEWLVKTVSQRDFVVVKMDVEGTEFYLVPRMIETGAMCLVDEMFLRCRHSQRTSYGQCLKLFSSIRERGILVHQWW